MNILNKPFLMKTVMQAVSEYLFSLAHINSTTFCYFALNKNLKCDILKTE